MTESSGSVSYWIAQLHHGREGAAEAIWERFHRQLLRIAARSLPDAARRDADEEDVVSVAFHSFFRRLDNGAFPELENRNELWRLLASMTRRKAIDLVRRQNRQKRREPAQTSREAPPPLDQFTCDAPTPELVAMQQETINQLLGVLDDGLREIAICRLEGYTNQEIAAHIRRSVPTVERRLRLIRQKWEGAAE